MVWIYFHRALPCAIYFAPSGLKLIPIPSLLKKRRAIREPPFFQSFPFSNLIREGELKGVSEN
jgi:hypothetical protein